MEQYLSLTKRWWLIVASMLVAAASSYYAVSRAPRIYRATTTLMVGQGLKRPAPNPQEVWLSEQLARMYADMANRQSILERAGEALDLPFTPLASAYAIPGTSFLEISVRDTDPERARVTAAEIARQLILQSPAGSSEEQDRLTFVQAQLQNLEDNITDTENEIKAEQEELDAANSARAIQEHRSNVTALQQKLVSYQSTYASLLSTVQGETNRLSVFDPAAVSKKPISPKVGETVVLAAAIGLVLAVGGAFLIEYIDDTIKTSEDVTRALDLPTLGAIARIDGREYPEKLIALEDFRSPVTESYRALRTNIQFSAVDKPARTLMITSPNSIEGKSVTLANLAVVMAQSGLSVIVVDTDLRRPVMHKIFDLDNSHGLSDAILRSDSGVAEHVRPTKVENLRLVTTGPLPPNPAELVGSERMKRAIEELKAQADMVLFDSPPTLAVTDATLLSTRVDGVLVVNDVGRTRRVMAQRAVESLRQVGANVLGVILNRLPSGRAGYYYYYYAYTERENGRRKRGLLR